MHARAIWKPPPDIKIPKILKHLPRIRDSGETLHAYGWSVSARWHEQTFRDRLELQSASRDLDRARPSTTISNDNQIDCLQL